MTAAAVAITTELVITGSLLLAGVGASASPQASATPEPTTDRVESTALVSAGTSEDDRFSLTILTPRTIWAVDEPIAVRTTLRFSGANREVVRSTGPIVVFEVQQLDGPIDSAWSRNLVCDRQAFDPGQVEVIPFRKSGHWDPEGELDAFWRSWFEDPDLRLPAGTYRIIARADHGRSCRETSTLDAAVIIEVVDDRASASVTDWGPLAVVSEPAGGDAGLGPGRLSIGTECVTFIPDDAEAGELGVTLVWSSDHTRWRPLDREIAYGHLDDVIRLADGDRVMLGGVPLAGDTPETAAQMAAWLEGAWLQPPDAACPAADLWHVGDVRILPRAEIVNPDGAGRGGGWVTAAGTRVLGERDEYAGAYLDRRGGVRPVFLVTANFDAAVERLKERFGDDIRFEVRQVERPLAELEAIQAAITDASEELRRQGVSIVEVASDTSGNVVFVGVLGRVTRATRLLAELVDRDAFRVEKVGRPELA